MTAPRPLPPAYLHLVDVLGADTANAFCRVFGGQRLYIPLAENLAGDHELVTRLGWEAAVPIAKAIGGDRIEVPSLRAKTRRDLVLGLKRAGWKMRRIAEKAGVSETRVQQICRECPDARQGDLFG